MGHRFNRTLHLHDMWDSCSNLLSMDVEAKNCIFYGFTGVINKNWIAVKFLHGQSPGGITKGIR